MSGFQSYLPYACAQKSQRLLRLWSDIETGILGKKIDKPLEKPIFVCGLARAGTTIVTHILNAHEETGSHLYRDLPFVEIPYFWSFMSKLYYGSQQPVLREHGDHIFINPDSPDSFEELTWRTYLEDYDNFGFCGVRSAEYSNADLEKQLPIAMNKILFVRGQKERYLSKGNYNLLRVNYIQKLFPDAKIILCVRNPFDHALSLANVHKSFLKRADKDPYFTKRLEMLGHFEFGPQRKPIKLHDEHYQNILEHWEKGEDYLGYLLQWKDAYSLALKEYKNNKNILWFDASNFSEDKNKAIDTILRFSELSDAGIDLEHVRDFVKAATAHDHEATVYDDEVQELYKQLQNVCKNSYEANQS